MFVATDLKTILLESLFYASQKQTKIYQQTFNHWIDSKRHFNCQYSSDIFLNVEIKKQAA